MKKLFILSAVFTTCMAAFFIAYFIANDNSEQKPVPNNEIAIAKAEEKTSEPTPNAAIEESTVNETTITPETKITFEYFNELDGTIEKSESAADEFIIGLNEEEVRNFYKDYDVIAFTEENLTLRKYVEKPVPDAYTLGTLNGYVTVYYGGDMTEDAVKEITDTPAAVLPEQDQENLAEGIAINGKEELMKILEDYGS